MSHNQLVEMTNAQLRRRRRNLMRTLQSQESDLIRGSLIERYTKCGKANCHCVKGKGHGPKYYLSVSYPKSRPKLFYIPKDRLETYRKRLDNLDVMRAIINDISDINIELLHRKLDK